MRREKRFMRLQALIAVSMIGISLFVTFVVTWSLYGKFKEITADNAIRETKNTLEQVNSNVQLYLEQLIQDCLFLESLLVKNQGVIDSHIETRFYTMYITRNNMVSISVLDEAGDILLMSPSYEIKEDLNVKEQDWFKKTLAKDQLYYITKPSIQQLFKHNYQWTYAICANIDYTKNGVLKTMVLRIDMDFKQIADLCNDAVLAERGYLFIVDGENQLVYHPDQSILATGQVQEGALNKDEQFNQNDYIHNKHDNTIITKSDMNYVNWSLVGVTYEDQISSISMEIIQFIFVVFALSIGIIIILALFISRQISKPVRQLEKSMQRVTEGDLETRITISSTEKEVIALANSFNHMVSRIQKLIKQNQREHELKRKSDLDALQAQINPHFLYNTLDSIVWMAECKQHNEVVEMVNALAILFRISISGGRSSIALSREINHAENYMLIQKKRYNDRFDYIINVPNELENLLVPKLILQPLIENALYHGLEYMVDPGAIRIEAKVKNHELYLYVIDNGAGMSPEDLKNIWIKVNSKEKGVGVKNVNERIQLMFGSDYGLSYESELEEGTTVTIKLPVIGNEVEDEK